MAKPTGAVDYLDFGYDITGAGETRDDNAYYSYLYAVVKADLQPGKWSQVNREDVYHRYTNAVNVTVDASGTANISIRIGKQTPDENSVFSKDGIANSFWLTSTTETIGSDRTNSLPNYNDSKIEPKYIIVELKMYRNATTAFSETVNINAFYLKTENYSSYAGNDFVSFSNDIVGDKINNPFDSLSSSMLKDAIAENLNKIMYESKSELTIPLFGDY